jgi:hypothetical protein
LQLRIDHKSLLNLVDQRLITGVQHKAFDKLMGLWFKIHYKQGATNGVADALFRKPEANGSILVVSSATLVWMENPQAGYQDGPLA